MRNVRVHIAALFSMLFWGFSFIWTKKILVSIPPIATIFFRLVLSSFFLLIVSVALKKLQRIKKEDIKTILLLTFFQPFLYFIGENIGLTYVSSTVASVLISTIPLLSPIAAVFFFKERLSAMNIIGLLISVIGVVLVILKDDFSLAVFSIGVWLLLGVVIAAVVYSVVVV